MKKNYRKVAVIGRPNVGKSTLFNRLLRERRSIVDDMPGVTRDRLYADIDWNQKGITLIDTGGIVHEDENEISKAVNNQVKLAIDEADFIIFMVDGTTGITKYDERISRELRKILDRKKIFLAVNKVDTEKQLHFIHDFYSLGLGEPYPISALMGSEGLADILDEIAKASYKDVIETEPSLKLAIVGKPNVGKSSILNAICNKERSIVTSIAGTTRDSLDTEVKVDGKTYTLIDTAGLRKKSKVDTKIERYSTMRTIAAIERADVVLFIVEANTTISDQDQKIAALIKKRERPSVILVNKWDLIETKNSMVLNTIKEDVLKDLHFINYSEVLFVSALDKKNLTKIWATAEKAHDNSKARIPTARLNKILEEIILNSSPPTSKGGKRLKIYFVTQTGIQPPEIVFFINDIKLVKPEYERFLERSIRDNFDFSGTPIKLTFRNKKEEK